MHVAVIVGVEVIVRVAVAVRVDVAVRVSVGVPLTVGVVVEVPAGTGELLGTTVGVALCEGVAVGLSEVVEQAGTIAARRSAAAAGTSDRLMRQSIAGAVGDAASDRRRVRCVHGKVAGDS